MQLLNPDAYSLCPFPWRVGLLIPKGWKVMPLFRNIHHNPDYFPDPQKFDPSRFKVIGLVSSRYSVL
jgi:cytochrome P450